MVVELFLREITIAEFTLDAILVFKHSPLELAFTPVRRLVSANHFAYVFEVLARIGQTRCLSSDILYEGHVHRASVLGVILLLFRIQLRAFLATNIIFARSKDFN